MPEQKSDVIQRFPKWKFHRTGKSLLIKDADAEAALGEGWRDSSAGPFGPPADSDPGRWLDSWDLQCLSPDARARIKAGLMEAHADVIESGREDGSRVREDSMQKAFDLFAKEYLDAGLLTESMMAESIPQNAYDAAVSGGWETGALERNSGCTLLFGHYWVPDRVPMRLKELFAAQVWRWQSKVVKSKLRSGEPALSGTQGAEDPAKRGPHTQLVPESEASSSAIPTAGGLPELEQAGDAESRAMRLERFRNQQSATYADIKHSASVHTSDFQKWRAGTLKAESVMSQRIEEVLSGRRALTRKPAKRRIE